MSRSPFNFQDLAQECEITPACFRLSGRDIGLRINVPSALYQQYPYNASAYAFLQQLRRQIAEYGIVEFPRLPLNKTNHTLAQRAPKEHGYSTNTYLTDTCQQPHQDTPPYPTAFWLAEPRRYFATWVHPIEVAQDFYRFSEAHPELDIEAVHKILVPASVSNGTGLLLNRSPGLLLFDNSHQHSLYHARTCNFFAVAAQPDYTHDAPMYAYNEVGLLQYIDSLDSRRGNKDRDSQDLADVEAFMQAESAGTAC